MDRREFLKLVAAAGAGAVAARAGLAAEDPPTAAPPPAPAPLPRRRYGAQGPELSVIGFGGIVVSGIEPQEAAEVVAWAVDRGVNYFDVAPSYGNAEERLGPALAPHRKKVFLACKTAKRDAAGARAELTRSLELLKTDHFDLYQLHGLAKKEDVETAFGPGGALETLVSAREEGLVRWLGFSAHDADLAVDALSRFRFDSVLVPLNAVCVENGKFGPTVVDKAKETGTTLLGLKALAWTKWKEGEERTYPKCWYRPADDPELAGLLLRYALDLPVASTIPPGDARLFRLAVELAARHRPLTARERQALLARLEGVEPLFRHRA
ncbi:MAG: aldo/keto reductase [Planctomycetes bacterium]|jgi:hypothetical protein|nr:aldo/keto reductase [Planctomycetota bacterium]